MTRRRKLAWLLAPLVLLLVVLGITLLTPDRGNQVAGDPDNFGRPGTRAVAQVLRQQGIQVDEARRRDQLTAVDANTTVLVGRTDRLTESAAADLADRASSAGQLVLLTPTPRTLTDLGIDGVRIEEPLVDTRAAGCDRFPGRVSGFEQSYTRTDPAPDPAPAGGCFADPAGAGVLTLGQTTLVGTSEAFSNAQVIDQDNAAFALRLLGERPRVIWYVPSPDDLVPGEAASPIPDWFGPAVWLAGLAAVALVFVAGRRLGPLATEPMPVVVRAIETTLGRGRLYQRSGDRAYALARLREGCRRRLARRARLGRDAPTADLIRHAAAETGRPSAEIAELLTGPAPATDRELLEQARALAALTAPHGGPTDATEPHPGKDRHDRPAPQD
ncbi:DUF4350 domain-containing protein [Enemella evansiae]|uniref:DUF4350 domain-containing protein n=1 Tax=Enemella evansiae TaxID=2016499 RepID=UPI0010E94EF5|nr:DUF4350 domain-containing protein [Enemella evansiae]TDO85952.1 uncharacterized protein DUF4350 [Enemella evansiae]